MPRASSIWLIRAVKVVRTGIMRPGAPPPGLRSLRQKGSALRKHARSLHVWLILGAADLSNPSNDTVSGLVKFADQEDDVPDFLTWFR